jgi:hypothetical protein
MRWRCVQCKDITEREDGLLGVYCCECRLWMKPMIERRSPGVIVRRKGRPDVHYQPKKIVIEDYPYKDHLFNPPGESN